MAQRLLPHRQAWEPAIHKRDGCAWLYLDARLLLARADSAGASAAFGAALQKDPKFVPAAAALAGIDLAAGRNEQARKRMQDLVAADPGNFQARMALAEITGRTGGTGAEVAQVFTAAVKADPQQPAPRMALINHLMKMGDAQAALIAAQDGVAALPNSTEMQSALGRAQLAAGDARQAVATFSQLATRNPTEAVHQLRLAEALVQNKDLGAARTALRKALELDPDSLAAKRSLAALALQQQRPDEARTIARELQKAKPNDASGYQLEGDLERQQRNWPAAVAAYRKAFSLARSSDLAIRLHQSLFAGGQRAEADRLVPRAREHAVAHVEVGRAAVVRGHARRAALRHDHRFGSRRRNTHLGQHRIRPPSPHSHPFELRIRRARRQHRLPHLGNPCVPAPFPTRSRRCSQSPRLILHEPESPEISRSKARASRACSAWSRSPPGTR